jgi:ABC-type polysaccharide/polyol phosphate export permease
MVMSIKRRWLYTIFSVIIADLCIRLSTSLYPIDAIPEIFRVLAIINPITYYANMFHTIFGVDPKLLLDPQLFIPILVSISISLIATQLLILRRLSEGSRF